MKIRLAPFFFALALVLAQLGAFGHGLSHYQHGPDEGQPHPVCELCAAYAGLDQTAARTSLAIDAVAAQVVAISPVAAAVHACAWLPYCSRAPPPHRA